MTCRLDSLRDKEVINVKDGGRIGFVSDAEVDTQEAKLTAEVVYGRLGLFGLLGRGAGWVMAGNEFGRSGEATGLVQDEAPAQGQRQSALGRLLEKIGF